MRYLLSSFMLILGLLTISACNKNNDDDNSESGDNATGDITQIENTYAFSILDKVKGIWSGPVTSSTIAGNFPELIIDLRPIGASQISSKNELDENNSLYFSLFIAKYENEYRIFFKNGGQFAGNTRNSYFYADSLNVTQNQAFYRFREVKLGENRAYTTFLFRNDSLILTAYTNNYNTLQSPVIHMKWSAKLRDLTSCQNAVSHFGFPQKVLTKDFSTAFDQVVEAIYYDDSQDPYSQSSQPYVGSLTASVNFQSGFTPNSSNNVFFMVMTQPLISNYTYNPTALNYRSRYVFTASSNNSFTFANVHPGTYYLYAFYDQDGNGTINSGDWVSTTATAFTVPVEGSTSASATINFTIP